MQEKEIHWARMWRFLLECVIGNLGFRLAVIPLSHNAFNRIFKKGRGAGVGGDFKGEAARHLFLFFLPLIDPERICLSVNWTVPHGAALTAVLLLCMYL